MHQLPRCRCGMSSNDSLDATSKAYFGAVAKKAFREVLNEPVLGTATRGWAARQRSRPSTAPSLMPKWKFATSSTFGKPDTMSYRRIAAAAVTVWIVSIPFGALIHHGLSEVCTLRTPPPLGLTQTLFDGCQLAMPFNC